jgi:hypothetical protein
MSILRPSEGYRVRNAGGRGGRLDGVKMTNMGGRTLKVLIEPDLPDDFGRQLSHIGPLHAD